MPTKNADLPAQSLPMASPRTSARELADIFMSQSCEGLPEPASAGEVMASVAATRTGQNTLMRILAFLLQPVAHCGGLQKHAMT